MGIRGCWISTDERPEPVEASEARVSALAALAPHGETLYETVRTYHARPFSLGGHLERLSRGWARMEFPPLPREEIEGALRALAARRAPEESALRVLVSLREGFLESAGGGPEVSWAALAGPLPPHVSAYYERGVPCIIASRPRWNPGSFVPAVKFAHNHELLMARREAQRAGAFEAILLSPSGLVAEGSASSVFLVKDRRLVTPGLEMGILDGVTRDHLLRLARESGIGVEERDVAPREIFCAEEVFLASTTREVIPVSKIDGATIGTGEPGRITDHLLGAYQGYCLETTRA